jgi:hypothetical protein
MVKANTKTTSAAVTAKNGIVMDLDISKVKELGEDYVYNTIKAFVAEHGGGNANNVFIEPLNTFDNLAYGKGGKAPCKTLGGYMVGAVDGKSIYGVRQSMLYHALNGQLSYGQWLRACLNTKKPSASNIGIPSGGQSANKPVVMFMLLCGGPSIGKGNWGIPQVRLVAKPATKSAKK